MVPQVTANGFLKFSIRALTPDSNWHVFPLHQFKFHGSFMILFAISREYLIPILSSINSNLLLIQASLSLPLSVLALATCKGHRSINPASGNLFPSSTNFPAESMSPSINGTVAQIPETMSSMLHLKCVTVSSANSRRSSFEDRSLAP